MYKIGVLGDKDSVMGFKSLGLDVFMTDSPDEAKDMLKNMSENNYTIIYITEQLLQFISEEAAEYDDKITPAIIPIPNSSGTLGIGMANVKKNIERAVGADII